MAYKLFNDLKMQTKTFTTAGLTDISGESMRVKNEMINRCSISKVEFTPKN